MTTEMTTTTGGTKGLTKGEKTSKSLKEYLDGPGIMAKLAEAAGRRLSLRRNLSAFTPRLHSCSSGSRASSSAITISPSPKACSSS